jgi:hypothetical protein
MDMHNDGDISLCWRTLCARAKEIRRKRYPAIGCARYIAALKTIQELSVLRIGGPVPIQALNRIGAVADKVLNARV